MYSIEYAYVYVYTRTMRSIPRGFTLIELLIVVSVIAILAAISVVSYSGSVARADYARAQTDMKHINDALTVYRSQNGNYPAGNGSFQATSTALTGLVPSYLDNNGPLSAKAGYSYLYRADTLGTNYALIRIVGTSTSPCGTLPDTETTNNSMLKTTGTCANNAWGYWSSGAASW